MSVRIRYFSVILLAILLTYGCAPVIPYAGDVAVPPVPEGVSFGSPQDSAQRILVIPVWKTYKGHIAEGKRTEYLYIIDDALIIKASELDQLHNIIPSRASYGITGLSSAYAVDNEFLGMYLVAESGEVVLLARANLLWIEKEIAWKGILDAWIGEAWKQDLIDVFRNATTISISQETPLSFWDARFGIPCEFFIRATDLPEELCKNSVSQSFPGHPLELKLSSDKRKDVVDFFLNIEIEPGSSLPSAWVPRDIYGK